MNNNIYAAVLFAATFASATYASEPNYKVAFRVVNAQGQESLVAGRPLSGYLSSPENANGVPADSYIYKDVFRWDCSIDGSVKRGALKQDRLREGSSITLSSSAGSFTLNIRIQEIQEQKATVLQAREAMSCPASIHGSENVILNRDFTVPAHDGQTRFMLDNGDAMLIDVTTIRS
ncbi:hypothetical protein [Silvimonas soli]|uniref:hypothetical protein n=1 Tax=Silvimonas soli TaxID=2980100 RepID=UPI0024B32304|nr:hypothetical protein [Silvimonas soli]